MLKRLSIKNVGPAAELSLEFGDRLNILTGDNGLGKSFLLDIAWWSLTRRWPAELNANLASGYMARPKPGEKATIDFSFTTKSGREESYRSEFNRLEQAWKGRAGRPANPGLVIYAQVDGSFSVWDPARNYWKTKGNIDIQDRQPAYVFSPKQVWDGLQDDKGQWLCNGLIRDWASWQKESKEIFGTLEVIIGLLSPSDGEEYAVGELTRISLDDARDMPTLKTPFGEEVPVVFASAGVRRIIALSYLLTWTFREHAYASGLIGELPSNQIVFLIDEIEAHLHPKWQRSIILSLLELMQVLANMPLAVRKELLRTSKNKALFGSSLNEPILPQVQIITATHSPLVMASVEPIFDPTQDAWFDLDLENSKVVLTRREFQRQGDASAWLMSEAFDLKSGRSLEAEKVLEEAALAMSDATFNTEQAQQLHQKLLGLLGDTDPFWVRWRFVSEKKGWLE
ncbi:MAG: AAA family ATPase [Candidatus Methylumidiphilus sp.]